MLSNSGKQFAAALRKKFRRPGDVLKALGLDDSLLESKNPNDNVGGGLVAEILDSLSGKLSAADLSGLHRMLEAGIHELKVRKLNPEPDDEVDDEDDHDDGNDKIRDYLKTLGLSAGNVEHAIALGRGTATVDDLPRNGLGGNLGGHHAAKPFRTEPVRADGKAMDAATKFGLGRIGIEFGPVRARGAAATKPSLNRSSAADFARRWPEVDRIGKM
jgi:hypothetical protein